MTLLTKRERELASLLMRECSNKEIAYQMGITEGTVKVHIQHMMGKLHTRTRLGLCIALMAPGILSGQARLSFTGAVVPTGSQAAVSINLAGGGMNPTALQVSFPVPTGATITTGPALGSMTLASNIMAGMATIVVYGNGTAVIPDGALAVVSWTAAGPWQFTPSNYLAVNALAQLVSFTAASLSWANPCDVTADGSVDGADVISMIQQIDGVVACKADPNGDKACTVQDLLMIQRAATGGACKVGA